MPDTQPAARAPAWVRSGTAGVGGLWATPTPLPAPEAPPPATPGAAAEAPAPPLPPLPTVGSPDGRFMLTDSTLTVLGQSFGLRELEGAEVRPVRWLLWYLLGGLGLAVVLILFLNNWLRTLPTMAGLLAAGLLLLYGHRGTNRLRLARLGREAVHVALPGEAATWQRLVRELNRRIDRAHDQAAAEAAALLAALEALPPAEPAIPETPA
ncbi:hypothetical protein [Hymenobacter psoromatis]|uniref:hypothetical protein n=1 Tax=Hymenobacter psoromatis TaxID=1484116 RepID=UPI001CBFD95C|nr:hypothetical protein [Hymenobacter psoromatis]